MKTIGLYLSYAIFVLSIKRTDEFRDLILF